MIGNICAPALLYVAFSLTQIVIDIFKNMYNTAFFKFIVMIIFTVVLNALCNRGLGIISWFIVFVPFIMMTVITTILLFVFGLSPSTGNLNYQVDYPNAQQNKNVVVVTKNGVNQPYENKQEVEPGSYTTADSYDPNNYNSGTPSDINNYN